MKYALSIPAAILAGTILTALPLHADGNAQLLAAAGLSETEASGMSLNEIYAHKINRESRRDDAVTVSARSYPAFDPERHPQLVAAAGLTGTKARGMSLSEVAAYKASRNAAGEDRIPVGTAQSADFEPADHVQLLAAAGLDVGDAEGVTLDEIYVRKINRESRRDDRQD